MVKTCATLMLASMVGFGSILPFTLVAQTNPEYKKMLAEYPDDHAVILKNEDKVIIDFKENALKVSSKHSSHCMYLDTKAGFYSEESLDFSKLEKITDIEASSFVPNSNNYKEIKVKSFETKDKISNSVFYDGGKSISFMYPSLQPGSKSYLSYTRELDEPRLLSPHFFQSHLPIIEAEYAVTVPNNVDISWKLFNIADSSFVFTKTLAKNKTTYTWKVKNVKKYKFEENGQDPKYIIPHIALWINSYKVNNTTVPYLSDPKSLYKWYYQLTKDANKEESPELKRITDSLVANKTEELEKVKAIYYWVQDNIKYIAVEDGMGGFIPRSGKTVCDKRYGDCKDMASIITKMMSYAKIPSYLTWIGTRSIPYRYIEVPTPIVDNHMIAAYKDKNNVCYFLDATGRGTPIHTPTSFIQGKEAMLGIDSTQFEIIEVPIIPRSVNKYYDSVQVILENNKLIGKGLNYNYGYYNINLSNRLAYSTKDMKVVLKDYFNKSSNKFLIDSAKVENLYGREKPVKIAYSFTIDSYVQQNQDETYVNLNLDKDYVNALIEPDRKLSIEYDNTSTMAYSVNLTIPDGYKVTYLPENARFDNKDFGFSISYKQKGNVVTLTKEVYIDTLIIEKKNFDTWNKMVKELKKSYSEVIILKKNNK